MVKKFLQQGILLSPEALAEGNEESILKKAKEHVVVTPDKPLVATSHIPSRLTIQEHKKREEEKFSFLESILMKKVQPVSISNIPSTPTSLIGMVVEKTENAIFLQDRTGRISVAGANASLGDVIGITGTLQDTIFMAQSVIYPDVDSPKKKKCVLSLQWDNEPVVVIGEKENLSLNKTISFGGISIITCSGKGNPAAWLRRRQLPTPSEAITLPLTTVPDVLWVPGDINHKEQYKGVMIVHSQRGFLVRVDVEKGTAAFTELSSTPSKAASEHP